MRNDNSKINNIEYYIKNNNNSKLITPHKSKHKMMPSNIKLNGIEISFSKISTNEEFKTHISTKNIVPIQHMTYLDNIGCFIDFSPLYVSNPIITIQNMISGYVYAIDTIVIPYNFNCKKYRGSTPFIEIENKLWITIVHKRKINNNYIHNIQYEYMLLIFDSKYICINTNNIIIPNKCIKEIYLNIDILKNNFIYITGLIILNKIFNINKELLELEILISYGISDKQSGISNICIKII